MDYGERGRGGLRGGVGDIGVDWKPRGALRGGDLGVDLGEGVGDLKVD